jgi:hypothetical protein
VLGMWDGIRIQYLKIFPSSVRASEYERSSSKNSSPKKQNVYFLENGSNDLIQYQ